MLHLNRQTTLLVLLLLWAGSSPAQTLGKRIGPQLPHLSVNARSLALGDASVALVDGRSGFQANPAIVSTAETSLAGYSFHRIVPGIALQHASAILRFGRTEGVGVDMSLLHEGEFDFVARKELRDRGFELTSSLTYARLLANDLFGGVEVRIYNSTRDTEPMIAGSVAFGLAYIPDRRYRFGLSVNGLGTDYRVENPVIPHEDLSRRIPKVVALGVAFEYPLGNSDLLLATYQNDKILGNRGILYRMGFEYHAVGLLALRAGAVLRGAAFEPRGGIGISISMLTLDYGYLFSRSAGVPSHIVSAAVFW